MRLRLWWHLCVLESRSPEDQGFQPAVDILNPKLRLPLNVNDDQLYPDMTHLPPESPGWTDMSFFLIQTEACRLIHPILDAREQQEQQQHHVPDAVALPRAIAEKRSMLRQRTQYLSAKYAVPAPHLARIVAQHRAAARLKIGFILQLQEEIAMQQPRGQEGPAGDDESTSAVLSPSFKLACSVLEGNHAFTREGLAGGFSWFFNLYTPWYALAYVLRCLCSSPGSRASEITGCEHAWALVDEVFPRAMSLVPAHGAGSGDDQHGAGWITKCLTQLRRQALSARLQANVQRSVAMAVAAAATDANIEIPPSRGVEHLRPAAGFPSLPMASTTAATAHEMDTLPQMGQEFMTDANQMVFTSMDLPMPEVPDWPDWNAILNGRLSDDYGHGVDRSGFTGHSVEESPF
jgi:hypothetical protein